LLLLLVASAVLILGPAAAQTDPPATGDWTVADTTLVENQTVKLNGSLKVSDGGNLTLRNVTLQVFSGSTVGTNGITVEAGGTLRIEDYNLTPSDQGRSTVMRGNPSRGYFFIAKPGSTLVLLNSNISGMGARSVSRGVLVQTNNTSIMGVMFIDGDQYCLRLEGTDGPAIRNSGFYLSDYGLMLKDTINVTVAQSTFTRNSKDGIWLDNATRTRLNETLVSNNNLDGMVVTDSEDLIVTDSIFYENTNGVVLRGVFDVLMDDCQINKSAFVGLILEDGTENVSLSEVEIFDIGRSGIQGNGVKELSLTNCTIRDCTYFGIRLLNRIFGLVMNHNDVVANGYDGIHIEGAIMVNMNRDNISRNGYNGIFMINSQDIMIHRVTLDMNAYDGVNLDSVSRATLEGITASGNGYNGVYIQAGSNRTDVWGSHLINNVRCGLAIDSAHDVDVFSCNISRNLDYGIRIDSDAYLVRLDHCNILNNAVGGIRVDNSRGIVGRNVTLLGGGAHVALDVRDGGDIWILNSTLAGTVDMVGFGNATTHVGGVRPPGDGRLMARPGLLGGGGGDMARHGPRGQRHGEHHVDQRLPSIDDAHRRERDDGHPPSDHTDLGWWSSRRPESHHHQGRKGYRMGGPDPQDHPQHPHSDHIAGFHPTSSRSAGFMGRAQLAGGHERHGKPRQRQGGVLDMDLR
jgi:parallel beta-helix repeat protein